MYFIDCCREAILEVFEIVAVLNALQTMENKEDQIAHIIFVRHFYRRVHVAQRQTDEG